MSKYSFLEFDEQKEYLAFCKKFRTHNRTPSYIRVIEWQHTKDAAIMKHLLEIITLQQEALKTYGDPKAYDVEYGTENWLLQDDVGNEARSTLAAVENKLKELK